MDDYSFAWFVLLGVLLVVMGLGYLAGQANPSKGEIIHYTFGPHKCKGIPKAKNWHEGTQWQCAECKDIWEVYRAYDGIESTLEWKRNTSKDKLEKTNFETYLEEQLKDPELKKEYEQNKMDYSDFVTIKITKVRFMGEPSHWEVEVNEDGMGGTGPNFGGVVDIAMSIICGEYGEEEWHKFDANIDRDKKK